MDRSKELVDPRATDSTPDPTLLTASDLDDLGMQFHSEMLKSKLLQRQGDRKMQEAKVL